MDRLAMRTRAKERFRDTANAIYTDAEWNSYLNEAYREIVTLAAWPFLETRVTNVTVAAAARTAPMPTDIWKVLTVYNDTDDWVLSQIDGRARVRRRWPRDDDSGEPREYRLFGSTIEVFPRPTILTTLHVEYMAYPADLATDATSPVFPAPYHQALIEAALARAYVDDGNKDQAASHREAAGVIITAMTADLLGTRLAENTSIVDDFWTYF